jgi:DHA2 family multidrug resistance protein-like MFS transporter
MNAPSSSDSDVRASWREWLGLAVLALPTLLVSLDIGALFLALPSISAEFGASSVEQLWITDIYGFLLTGFLITMGTLGDRIGRRRLLLIGAAAFGVMSVAAAYSTSPEMLIRSRAALGIAGATLMPSTLALITNMFRDPRQMGIAIATWVSCMMVGAAIGPVVGGLLLSAFWWGAIFLLGVPVAVALLVLGPFLLPEYRNPQARRLDLTSVLLSLAGILPIVYGIKELTVSTSDSPAAPLVSIAIGLVASIIFLRRQLRLSDPLLDLSLFRSRAFSSTLAAMLLVGSTMAGAFLLTSQYVQSVLAFSPAAAGLWLLPTGLSIALGAQLAPTVAKRFPSHLVISGGLVLGAVGWLLMSQVTVDNGPLLAVVGIGVVHLGAGPLLALGAGIVMSSAPPERAGSAASISESANHFGATLGLALIGTLGTAIYRSRFQEAAPPELSPEGVDAAAETIGGAVAVVDELPGTVAESTLTAAGEAFTTGLNVAAVVGGIVFLLLAVLMYATQRPAKTQSTSGEDASHEVDHPRSAQAT